MRRTIFIAFSVVITACAGQGESSSSTSSSSSSSGVIASSSSAAGSSGAQHASSAESAGGSSAEGQSSSSSVVECQQPVTMAQVQDAVFISCGGHGVMTCHSREPYQADLDLSDATASHAALVNVDSVYAAQKRVVPGDVEGSFLWRKLNNTLDENGGEGEPMPKGEAIQWQRMPDEQMNLVRCWIAGGAAE